MKRVAVVGAGPAGLYATQEILKRCAGVGVDVLERLVAPFGLVRHGVAPFHPDTKRVEVQFAELLAARDRVRYCGGVEVGAGAGAGGVPIDELRARYAAVVLACGADGCDRTLGVPGEAAHVLSARDFIALYGGHPRARGTGDAVFARRLAAPAARSAVVVGNGNVALDVARMLLLPPRELGRTDVTAEAQAVLARTRLRDVHVVGRRGALDAAFTLKELREIARSEHWRVRLAEPQRVLAEPNANGGRELSRPQTRLMKLLGEIAAAHGGGDGGGGGEKDLLPTIHLHFERAPARFAAGVMETTRVDEPIACDVAFRAVGYRAVPPGGGVPFDEARCVVPSGAGGRVDGESGLYVCGWLRRGPSGIIGTNRWDADEVADGVAEDLGRFDGAGREWERAVSFDEWLRVDAAERLRGDAVGKVREKIVDQDEARSVAAAEKSSS